MFYRLQSETLVKIQWVLISLCLASGLLASFVWFYMQGESGPYIIRVIALTGYLAGCASLLAWLGTLNTRNQLVVGIVLGIGALVLLNADLYRFFAQKGGFGLAVGAFGLHSLYFLYSKPKYRCTRCRYRFN